MAPFSWALRVRREIRRQRVTDDPIEGVTHTSGVEEHAEFIGWSASSLTSPRRKPDTISNDVCIVRGAALPGTKVRQFSPHQVHYRGTTIRCHWTLRWWCRAHARKHVRGCAFLHHHATLFKHIALYVSLAHRYCSNAEAGKLISHIATSEFDALFPPPAPCFLVQAAAMDLGSAPL